MFDRLKRSLARSRHQDHVNDALKNLQKALPGMDFEKVVDVTSNSHLEAWLEGLSDRTAAAKIQPIVKELQILNLDRKRLYADLLDRFHTKDAPPQNGRKGMEAYLEDTNREMKDVEEYFGTAGSGGMEQIGGLKRSNEPSLQDIMEDRIELIKDIIHLLPEHYEYRGEKYHKPGHGSVPATPTSVKEANLPTLPQAELQAAASPTSPVVAGYVN